MDKKSEELSETEKRSNSANKKLNDIKDEERPEGKKTREVWRSQVLNLSGRT